MYKCCWNCGHAFTCSTSPKEQEDKLNASKRLCCAPYPVSNRFENPFKRRYCKQFHEANFSFRFRAITKEEAEEFNRWSPEKLVEYWFNDVRS